MPSQQPPPAMSPQTPTHRHLCLSHALRKHFSFSAVLPTFEALLLGDTGQKSFLHLRCTALT